ncbi:MAG TPA: hypothetical protein VKB67_03665 [Rhizomicrobium sp.]|nr:hypothetical protein [Rhizomicrobium sp.]
MSEGLKALRAHYMDRIRQAVEAAARAPDLETKDGWKKIAEGYRDLLARLPEEE